MGERDRHINRLQVTLYQWLSVSLLSFRTIQAGTYTGEYGHRSRRQPGGLSCGEIGGGVT